MKGAEYIVEPLTGCDHAVKNIVVDLRYIITGLLDAELMLDALCDLIERRWQHAGARIHKKSNGQLELHIPKAFDDVHPPVLFDVYDAAQETPLSACFRRLPDVDHLHDRLSCFEDVMETTPAASALLQLREATSPRAKRCASSKFGPERQSIDQICSGGPMLTVLLYHFPHSGETVIRTLFPHVAWDAGAMADFMRAWTSAVNDGNLNSIPEVLPVRDAPRQLLSLSAGSTIAHTPSYPQQANRLPSPPDLHPKTALNIFIIVAGMMWRNVILPLLHLRRPRRNRSIKVWIPQSHLDTWRREAMLSRPANLPPGSDKLRLSDNDLIISWAAHILSQTRRSVLYGSFSIPLPVNMRTVSPDTRHALGIPSPSSSSRDQQGSKVSATTTAVRAARKALLHNWLSVITLSANWSHISDSRNEWHLAWSLRSKIHSSLRTSEGIHNLSTKLAAMNRMSFTDNTNMNNDKEEEKEDASFLLLKGGGTGGETLPAPPAHDLFIATNWTQSDFMTAANFARAVIAESATDAAKKRASEGRPSHMLGLGLPVERRAESIMFPQVIVFYKVEGEGLLTAMNVDEELVVGAHARFGQLIDLGGQ